MRSALILRSTQASRLGHSDDAATMLPEPQSVHDCLANECRIDQPPYKATVPSDMILAYLERRDDGDGRSWSTRRD